MRELIIGRIIHLLLCNGGSSPGDTMNFTGYRFGYVAARFTNMIGKDPDTKAFRKSLHTFVITENDLSQLTDDQLIELYELVVNRSCRQM